MTKLLLASASLVALTATGALAEGLSYGTATVSMYSRDGGDYRGIDTNAFARFDRGRLGYSILAERYVELKDNGNDGDYDNGTLELSVYYEVIDGLDLGVAIGRYASTNTAYNYVGLGANYARGNVMISADVAAIDDSTDTRQARLAATYAPTEALTFGMSADRFWFNDGDGTRTDVDVAINYDAERFDLTAYGEWNEGGDKKRFALAGVYDLTDRFSVVAAAGFYAHDGNEYRQSAAGVRYGLTDQLSVEALYANTRHNGGDFPGFGVSVSWDFGKPAAALDAMAKYRKASVSTAYGYY